MNFPLRLVTPLSYVTFRRLSFYKFGFKLWEILRPALEQD